MQSPCNPPVEDYAESAGETKVLGEDLPQYHFVYHKSHMESNPGRRGGKLATNHLHYGIATISEVTKHLILFIYGLFNNIVSNSDYEVSRGRMTSDQ
jgi:hypothetical protein